jgi:MFS family permease
VLGSLIGGWPTQRYGRRATLLGIGVLYLISAVGTGLARRMERVPIRRRRTSRRLFPC